MKALSRRALNRALLARQLLLERAKVDVVPALEKLAGLQAQSGKAPYFALLARLEGFTPDALSTLIADRSAVRIVLMRGTVHLVSARDCKWLRPTLDETLVRLFNGQQWKKDIGATNPLPVAKAGRALVEKEPLSLDELGKALAPRWPEVSPKALAQVVRTWVPLVQVPPRGMWGVPGQARCTSAEKWLGALDAPSLQELVKRYLAAFGPASAKDAQVWSGVRGLQPVFDELRGELVTFKDEAGRELFDLPQAPRPDEDTPAPVRLLGEYEQTVLSYDDRTRILGDVPAREMMSINGIIAAPVLIDGFTRGTWRLVDGRVKLALLGRVSKDERRALKHEAERVEAFGTARP